MHFRIRVGMFVEELASRHQGNTIVVVCHGGVINAAFDYIFNIGAYRRCDIRGKHTGVTYFQWVGRPDREPWRLHYLSRLDHLVGIKEG